MIFWLSICFQESIKLYECILPMNKFILNFKHVRSKSE
jgi:hypothetical protein